MGTIGPSSLPSSLMTRSLNSCQVFLGSPLQRLWGAEPAEIHNHTTCKDRGTIHEIAFATFAILPAFAHRDRSNHLDRRESLASNPRACRAACSRAPFDTAESLRR